MVIVVVEVVVVTHLYSDAGRGGGGGAGGFREFKSPVTATYTSIVSMGQSTPISVTATSLYPITVGGGGTRWF